KAAGEVLDVAKTAMQCQTGGNSNTLIFTSI
ncbi:TPA: type IV pilin protein, partial [Escherichia coli]